MLIPQIQGERPLNQTVAKLVDVSKLLKIHVHGFAFLQGRVQEISVWHGIIRIFIALE